MTAAAAAAEEARPGGRRRGAEDARAHRGLPDTIEDAVYRSLQTKRHERPGLGLVGCWPECSAVAYKSFNDPGPTQCSKLRVYRPGTSSADGNPAPGPANAPAAVAPPQRLTDIKLALCWDLDAPFDRGGGGDPSSAARVPRNSSSAAVMGFVRARDDPRPPADGDEVAAVPPRKDRNPSAVAERPPSSDRRDGAERSGDAVAAAIGEKPPSSGESGSTAKTPGQPAADDVRRRPSPVDGPLRDVAAGPPRRARRPCLACDHPDAVAGRKTSEPPDGRYKMAFKAGAPVDNRGRGKPGRRRRQLLLEVPKPRTTNSDGKKYAIGTLLPPFSMWPGTTARDYPEHWRLTSVYRQAFKPLELRKRPLLQTVYL